MDPKTVAAIARAFMDAGYCSQSGRTQAAFVSFSRRLADCKDPLQVPGIALVYARALTNDRTTQAPEIVSAFLMVRALEGEVAEAPRCEDCGETGPDLEMRDDAPTCWFCRAGINPADWD